MSVVDVMMDIAEVTMETTLSIEKVKGAGRVRPPSVRDLRGRTRAISSVLEEEDIGGRGSVARHSRGGRGKA